MYCRFFILAGATAILAAGGAMAADGKTVYDTKCVACHAVGVANAPKFGDKAAWEPRIKQGMEALIKSVVTGKTAMPPRAGQNVSDAEIKAGVEYMVNAVK